MKTLQDWWLFFNGKKTTIAAAIFTVTFFLTQFKTGVLIDIWGLTIPAYFDNLLKSADWIASILGGVGLVHKAVKPKV